jgi:RNA polymerase sigma factor (sigma-70 family)
MFAKIRVAGEEVPGGMTGANQAEDPWVGSSINVPPAGSADAVAGDRAAGPAPTVDFATLDDRELLALVRTDDDAAAADAAFAEVFARHASSVRGYALRCSKDPADAEDIAAEAFFRVLQAVRRGSGPADNVRAYLFTVTRRLAAELSLRNRDVPVADEELSRRVDPDHDQVDGRADQHLIAAAFSTLPLRWRSVLWRVEVEGQRPAVVAGQFGLSPNATAALARRAREGLRAAYLQAHVAPSVGPTGCRTVAARLGAFTAGQLRGGEARRIRAHLTGCADCGALHAELSDVCAGLRRYAGFPMLGGGLALGGSHLAAAKPVAVLATRLLGRVAGVGVRLKVAVAVASVAVVGGAGMGLAPMLVHPGPSVHADNQNAVLLPLISSQAVPSGGSAAPGLCSASRPATDPGHPATSKPGARRPADAPPDAPSDALPPGAADRAPAASTTTGAVPPGEPRQGSSTGSASTTMQLFEAPSRPSRTSDPEPATKGPAISRTTDPDPTLTTDPTTDPTRTRTGHAPPTVWSTVYTTDGTTIWETIWEWSGPG